MVHSIAFANREDLSKPFVETSRDGFALAPDWRGRFVDAYREQMQAWVASAASGRPAAGSSAWDGYVASATAAACLEARRTGSKVRIDVGPRPDFYV